ncbi:MAG: tRNA (adenosine(37)-N6)-threonylcarbamoyltransferase complex ATPase subunit type 1 TsaE [Deltaproteobacteria bacterium]|nr:tRNA (adenosine(37)-N6)-threonylcarbamoyltransferase complex ATPase subunit type 1 TsaE [Deltaproteobacteria bacterium]
MQLFVHTRGPDDTQRLAALLAVHLPPMCFALYGDLGAGKTTFVQGLIHSLPGGEGLRVQSPTFALAKSYDTQPVVHHLDLYRLDDETACYDLGLADLLEDESCIRCLEWPERAPSIVAGLQTVSVHFDDEATDDRKHRVDLSQADDAAQQKVLAALQEAFGEGFVRRLES